MAKKKDKEQPMIVPYAEGLGPQQITIREQPTTKIQKTDLWIQDWKHLFKRYWWLMLLIVLLVGGVPFIYVLSTTPSFKLAVAVFFRAVGVGLGVGLLFVITKLSATLFVFVVGYRPVKKLMARKKISFNELNAEKEEVLTIRKTSDEVILYRDRPNIFQTILRGKEKIHIDFETFDLLERVGEPKVVHLNGEKHEILRITIIPEREMAGEEVFIEREDGLKTFNTNYRIDSVNVEEYLLKATLPDVDPSILRRTLINLTKQNNVYRNKISNFEKQFEHEIDRRFWSYLTENTPRNYSSDVVRKMWDKVSQEPEGDQISQYRQYLREEQLKDEGYE